MCPCSVTSIPRGSRLTERELRLFSSLFMLVISVTVDKAFIGMGYCGSTGKESACSTGDVGSIPGLRRSSGEGKGYPLQYSDPENSMDRKVHGVTESDTTERLSLSYQKKSTKLPSVSGYALAIQKIREVYIHISWVKIKYLRHMGHL